MELLKDVASKTFDGLATFDEDSNDQARYIRGSHARFIQISSQCCRWLSSVVSLCQLIHGQVHQASHKMTRRPTHEATDDSTEQPKRLEARFPQIEPPNRITTICMKVKMVGRILFFQPPTGGADGELRVAAILVIDFVHLFDGIKVPHDVHGAKRFSGLHRAAVNLFDHDNDVVV